MLAVAVDPLFSKDERAAVVKFWNEPHRYEVKAPEYVKTQGPWVVRLSTEGSVWLWNFNKVRGLGKVPPTVDAGPKNELEQAWDRWIAAKIAYDRWSATVTALDANERATNHDLGDEPPAPADPGPMPDDLLALAGNSPNFASVVSPLDYSVTFDPQNVFRYQDNVAMRPRYAYYRFETGVVSGGTKLSDLEDRELDSLFTGAQISASAQKVMKAVSGLEGGFDSVNTYDTGYVSVGFLQFATLSEGGGSLGDVLLNEKSLDSRSFQSDFRRFGIDVTSEGIVTVVDPATGAELRGPAANYKIIEDKRLTATFQFAGKRSRAFRVAQLRVAYQKFYPGLDDVTIAMQKGPQTVKVGAVIRSEAGLATLMDRKVNTGKLGNLSEVLSSIAQENAVTKPEDLLKHEPSVIARMKYRKDYLALADLSQPKDAPPSAKTGTLRTLPGTPSRSTEIPRFDPPPKPLSGEIGKDTGQGGELKPFQPELPFGTPNPPALPEPKKPVPTKKQDPKKNKKQSSPPKRHPTDPGPTRGSIPVDELSR